MLKVHYRRAIRAAASKGLTTPWHAGLRVMGIGSTSMMWALPYYARGFCLADVAGCYSRIAYFGLLK